VRLLSLAWVKLNCGDITENRVDCTDSAPDARTRFRARAVHFGRDRFGRANCLPSSKRTTGAGVAYFEWPLRTSHQEWFIQGSREGANSLLEHVRENCRCPREYNRCRCRCGHACSFGRKIYPRTNALFHAVHRGRRNARRVPAWLSCIARLCPHASGKRDCVLQFSQRRNSGYCVRKDASGPLFGPVAIDVSKTKQSIRRSTLQVAVRSALCTASALVAVRLKAFSNSRDWCWRSWARAKDRQGRPGY